MLRRTYIFSVSLAVAFLHLNTLKAAELNEFCSPISNLIVRAPFETTQVRPSPLSSFPLIEKSTRGYIIIYKDNTGRQTIALLPYRDDILGNPTADATLTNLQIRGQVKTTLKPGFVTLSPNKIYPLVARSNALVKIRFLHIDFTNDFWIPAESIISPPPSNLITKTQPSVQSSNPVEGPIVETLKGVKYYNVSVQRVEPDGITIRHSSGLLKISFNDLPQEVRNKFNYDPAKHQHYYDFQKEQAQRARVAQELERKARHLRFRLAQVMDDGSLAYTGKYGKYGWENDDEPIFIEGLVKGVVDGDTLSEKLYPIGTYTYTTVQGASKKVLKYALSPQVALLYIIGPPRISATYSPALPPPNIPDNSGDEWGADPDCVQPETGSDEWSLGF